MKSVLAILFGFVLSSQGQNWSVSWTGPNTNGTPFYWPIIGTYLGTNTIPPNALSYSLTMAQIDAVIATNSAAFISNLNAQSSSSQASFQLAQSQLYTNVSYALLIASQAITNLSPTAPRIALTNIINALSIANSSVSVVQSQSLANAVSITK